MLFYDCVLFFSSCNLNCIPLDLEAGIVAFFEVVFMLNSNPFFTKKKRISTMHTIVNFQTIQYFL